MVTNEHLKYMRPIASIALLIKELAYISRNGVARAGHANTSFVIVCQGVARNTKTIHINT